ncbi:flagellar protein [Marinobacterium aestuarii]|uniref:Flagellar protein FliL n=1 Tax=Marinobacterium aestuarii TaxID=1821621 RepID=A0A1A9EW53_9GAMM|nr:flagellar basal body-associated FliL family protein [Marinobacterium aestuarii]ANG61753.1 flagellar protein [Marinobacterium aestuarii]
MAQDNAVEDGAAGKSAKSGRLMMVAAVLLALLIGGGGVAAFFMFTGSDTAPAGGDTAAPVVKAKALYTKIRTLEGRPMFVVTLASDDGKRHFLQTYIEAKSRDQEVVDVLTLHMPLIVARLNALFSTQKFEQLQTMDGKIQLRTEALELLQGILQEKAGRPGVEALLFTNFVMQ